MNRRNLIGALTCFPFVGCSMFKRDPGPQLIDSKNIQRLQATEWELRAVTIDGNEVVMHSDGKMAVLFGADGTVQGFGGVNQFAGNYSVSDDGKLAWGKTGFVTTRKSGPPEFVEKEKLFLDAMRRTTRAIAGKVILTLQSENAEVVLTFLKPGSL